MTGKISHSTLFHILAIAALAAMPFTVSAQTSSKDLLGMAIEYFGAKKYQEALTTFGRLEKSHSLSARMMAYKGICQYRLELYEEAVATLSNAAPQMSNFSPHEQAVYYYAWGESNFQLGRYFKAIPCLKSALEVCPETDKAEVMYRLGFCSYMISEYEDAIGYFADAEKYYDISSKGETETAHREQCRHMLRELLVTHGPRRMDTANEVTRQDENKGTDQNGADINEKPE